MSYKEFDAVISGFEGAEGDLIPIAYLLQSEAAVGALRERQATGRSGS